MYRLLETEQRKSVKDAGEYDDNDNADKLNEIVDNNKPEVESNLYRERNEQ